MAGKTATKVKDEPKVDKEYVDKVLNDLNIDDLVFRIDKAEEEISNVVEAIDNLDLSDLSTRVGKVEARLGIG